MKKALVSLALLLLAISAAAGNINGRVTCSFVPMQGVPVSDGVQIVLTDATGRYSLDSDKSEGMVFVITPSGYIARSDDGLRPAFWQNLHLPANQAETHDFVLEPQDQSQYTVLFPTDLHITGEARRDDIRRFKEIVFPAVSREAAAAKGPVYSFNLGDFTHDIYWYQFGMDEATALRLIQDLGWPGSMYTVMGNHDHDGAIVGEDVDRRAAWMQRDCWGPGAYAHNIGREHWVFLDNIEYINVEGKGKKSPGIKGDRSYNHSLTDTQLAWLEQDLALLSPDARICICTHCPILNTKTKGGCYLPKGQMKKLAEMCGRFSNDVSIFSGHIHYMDICDNPAWPRFHQYGLPATSGIMWETPVDWCLTCSDGSDAGLWIGEFNGDAAPAYRYDTFAQGENYFRFYDLNEVGKAYKTSNGVKIQQQLFPDTRLNYAASKWRNYVFVNYWGMYPGDTVQMFENGKELIVTNEKWEDPVKNFAYELPKLENPVAHHSGHAKDYVIHMYSAKAKTAKSPIRVVIKDSFGNIKIDQTFTRPYPFNPSGKSRTL